MNKMAWVIIIATLFLAACAGSNPKLKINTVANANLTDREEVQTGAFSTM